MKTKLPASIEDTDQARAFFIELFDNKESFHPDCDAHDVAWPEGVEPPTPEECSRLNTLMNQVFDLDDNFDRYQFQLGLANEEKIFGYRDSGGRSLEISLAAIFRDSNNDWDLLNWAYDADLHETYVEFGQTYICLT